jgi:electron transfer flavoprotein alpha subunit
MASLVVADHDNKSIKEETARAISAALQLDETVDVLVAGKHCQAACESASKFHGVKRVLVSEHDIYKNHTAESLADLVVSAAADYRAILAPATSLGKSVLPRVAALLDVMQISEIIDVSEGNTFKRSIYAGNAIQVLQSKDPKLVITVRTSAFQPAAMGGSAEIVEVAAADSWCSTILKSDMIAKSDRPELGAAKIVISGGRSLGSADNFRRLIEPIAEKLGAAVGASRAAVDAGYAPNNLQVGQTGKVVAPEIYIAVGISGAIQHLAGMKDSKTIVAINNDPEAPIFSIADLGLVADLFTALPELEAELSKQFRAS